MKAPNLKKRKRKTMVISQEALVTRSRLQEDRPPLVYQPAGASVNLAEWIAHNREEIRQDLNQTGALLFRGFPVTDVAGFQTAVKALAGDLLNYTERSSPRHAVEDKVYTSTDYPPEETIFLHNEQSYNLAWCRVIAFYCPIPAARGGQTPIADTRRIVQRLDPRLVDRFRKDGYIYRRNFGDGFGLTWQTAFQTSDKSHVERYCSENDIRYQWGENDHLTTWQRRPALRIHPETGEEMWFNHATFFHVSTLPEHIRKRLTNEFDEKDLPNQTFHGDGSSIEPATINAMRQAYEDEKILFDWQTNDVLILDNMRCSHGREPFGGDRRVLVSMAEPCRNPDEDFSTEGGQV